MKLTPNRIVALFLSLWVVAMPAIAAAPAAAMATMSMSDDSGTGGCDGCPDKGVAANDCAQSCVTVPFIGLAPENSYPLVAVTGGSPLPLPRQHLRGQFPVPDPGPPRPTHH
jgi:hypothetical protein